MGEDSRGIAGPFPTDAELVAAARAGEAWAREALFKRHQRLIVGLCQRILAGQQDADDVVQDALVEAFSHLDRLSNPQAFASWVSTIVVRRCLRHLRRRKWLSRLGLRSEAPVDPDELIAPGAPADVVAELRAVYEGLERLPADERVALVLRRVEGLELSQVALHLGVSLATLKRRIAAGDERLRRSLRPVSENS